MSLLHFPQWGMGNIAIAALQGLGLGGCAGELNGENAGYSKFAHPEKAFKVPSRVGMLSLYAPALAVSGYYLSNAPNKNGREVVTAGLLCLHFGKRVLESLFLHKYSGTMDGDFLIPISTSYALTAALIAHQQLQVTEYSHTLAYPLYSLGLVLTVLGQAGNFYHHYLLAHMRKDGEKGYVIPSGGLFNLVTMPHYFCELVAWLGIACVTQQLNALLTVADMVSYLAGRSVATTRWYRSKFDNYPKDRKHLIPFLL